MALKLHKIGRQLERVETKMGDITLRLTITETRLEERRFNSPLQKETKLISSTPKKRGRPVGKKTA